MEHSEFVVAWNQRKLEVDIDRSKALQIANSKMLPKRYRAAHIFWSWVWILSIPAAIAVMFLYKWWVGLLILILVTPLISKSTKKSAMQFMIDYALESPEFYQFALAEGVIRIRQKP
jgi:hypothetical protein